MNYYQLIFKPDFRDRIFCESRTYIFKSELELEKGDYVVAMTKFGYQIAVVYEKNEVEASNMYGEGIAKIVTKLDGNYYLEKRQEAELKEIEKILNKKTKEMSKIMQYETLAKYDPDVKMLLEKYKDLKGGALALPAMIEDSNEYGEDIPF